jgi:hypothetical protein
MSRVLGVAFFLASLGLALGAVHLRAERTPVDYTGLQGCIAHAERAHPLVDEHQELVNALYACGVYRPPRTEQILQAPPWLPLPAARGT